MSRPPCRLILVSLTLPSSWSDTGHGEGAVGSYPGVLGRGPAASLRPWRSNSPRWLRQRERGRGLRSLLHSGVEPERILLLGRKPTGRCLWEIWRLECRKRFFTSCSFRYSRQEGISEGQAASKAGSAAEGGRTWTTRSPAPFPSASFALVLI